MSELKQVKEFPSIFKGIDNMSKLNQKILELGYEIEILDRTFYIFSMRMVKSYGAHHKLVIHYNYPRDTYGNCCVESNINYTKQWHIDELQQAYNQLQQDLEILEEYE